MSGRFYKDYHVVKSDNLILTREWKTGRGRKEGEEKEGERGGASGGERERAERGRGKKGAS